MANYQIRTINRDDFDTIMRLENEIFGGDGEPVLGPYYVRLVCEFYGDSCFVAMDRGEAVGYLLSFIRDRQAYCTTLAVKASHRGSLVVHRLVREFTRAIVNRVDLCWFTVKEDNEAARALHASLGAQDVEVRRDFYGPGDERIVSCIDREGFEKLRSKYERMGLITRRGEEAA
jgi:ribosomal protein S18 acetylase RimI-like enzyme